MVVEAQHARKQLMKCWYSTKHVLEGKIARLSRLVKIGLHSSRKHGCLGRCERVWKSSFMDIGDRSTCTSSTYEQAEPPREAKVRYTDTSWSSKFLPVYVLVLICTKGVSTGVETDGIRLCGQ